MLPSLPTKSENHISLCADFGGKVSVTKKFTSYNKDTEASTAFLNYAVFRQHSARLGRFHMADPVQDSTSNPQSLNRFSYGLSDPINNVDPTGLFNIKIYIPPDWPCSAWSVVCGCDPFDGGFGPGAGFGPGPGAPGPGDGDSSGTSGCTLGGGGGSAAPKGCDVRLVVTKSYEGYDCSLAQTPAAQKMEIRGADVGKNGNYGRVTFSDAGVTAESPGSRNGVNTEGKPYHTSTDRTVWYQKITVFYKGSLTWTLSYKCDNHVAAEPLKATTTFSCRK